MASEEVRVKCEFGVGCCSLLQERLEVETRAKGFHLLYIMNATSKAEQFFGVFYKSSARDQGLLLNFCPFCGTTMGDEWVTQGRSALDAKNLAVAQARAVR